MEDYKLSLEQWQLILKNETNIIVNASHTNEQDDFVDWPIGMSVSYLDARKEITDLSIYQLGDHSKLVL